jgi:hypothetical protein
VPDVTVVVTEGLGLPGSATEVGEGWIGAELAVGRRPLAPPLPLPPVAAMATATTATATMTTPPTFSGKRPNFVIVLRFGVSGAYPPP